jgi:hypothetical protein
MARKLIRISKKQHDAINEMAEAIKASQHRLTVFANAILMGQEEEIPVAQVLGARYVDGEYVMAIEVPDIPTAADLPRSAAG